MKEWNSWVSSSHQNRVPTFFAGIRVYNSQGLSMNFAYEAAAVGNCSALFLAALLWWKHELTKDFCQFISALQGLDFTMKWQHNVRHNFVFTPDAFFQGSFCSGLKHI